VAKKNIPVADIKAQIDQISQKIWELEIRKKTLQETISLNSNDAPTTRRQKPNSKFRQAIEILGGYHEGLSIKQLIEKAKEKGIDLQLGTLQSQFSKASKEKDAEITRKDDGRWIVSFYG